MSRMKAIDLFPYWGDNRALITETVGALRDEDLDVRPAPGFRSVGDVLRHVITTEEYWWHGGIQGEPYARWRAPDWEHLSDHEKDSRRRHRFPTVQSIFEGLSRAHAPVERFIAELDAADLCEKRRSTWAQDNTLRWILWHLVEHDQHHRAQLYTRIRMLGRERVPIWPRPQVMAQTPAAGWINGEATMADIVPFWKQVNGRLREAVAGLTDDDLRFAPFPGHRTIHDLVVHLIVVEDFAIRQHLGGQKATARGGIQEGFVGIPVSRASQEVDTGFTTVGSLLAGLDAVHAETRRIVDGLSVPDLAHTLETPAGPETVHHVLWYAREHAVHHRAQLFLCLRMLGRTPPAL
jgi:uncharacterized damage-inducible protein DinB